MREDGIFIVKIKYIIVAQIKGTYGSL